VRHAVLAIDNDGGSTRRPEHEDTHDRAAQMKNPNGACSVCLMESSVTRGWSEQGGQLVLAVPIPTIETWLLVARGDEFEGRPESGFHRPTLKKRLYGKPAPPVAKRLELALGVLADPNALRRLQKLRSFARFEQQARSWLSVGETTAPST